MKKDDFVLSTSWGWLKRIPGAIVFFWKNQFRITYFLWGFTVGVNLCELVLYLAEKNGH